MSSDQIQTYVDRCSLEELKLIHHQDRKLLVRLMKLINGVDSSLTRVIAFLNWLDLRGFGGVVHQALSDMDDQMLYYLVGEALLSLDFLFYDRLPKPYYEFVCLSKVVCLGFSLSFLAENRERATECVDWFIHRVYRRVFNDCFSFVDDHLPVRPIPPPRDYLLYAEDSGENSGSVPIAFDSSGVVEVEPERVGSGSNSKGRFGGGVVCIGCHLDCPALCDFDPYD